MSDPVGLIGTTRFGEAGGIGQRPVTGGAQAEPGAQTFKDVLLDNLAKVNQLQQDATTAIEDLSTGKRNDLETVLLATQRADTAFKMLQSVRNKVMEAYEEIKSIRV